VKRWRSAATIDKVPRVRRARRFLIATLVAAIPLLGCQRQAAAGKGADGAIFILIDALRADHLGCYGYARKTSPNMDALAGDATLFANAVSPAPWTLPTMGTIWTSLYPSVHGAVRPSNLEQWMRDKKNFRPVTSLHESRTTLAEVLQKAGFATIAYVDGSYPGAAFGFAQGFDEFVEDELYGIRLHTEALLDWLGRKHPERFFAYIHVVEVHSPYGPPGVPSEMIGRNDAHARHVLQVLAEERKRYPEFDFDPDYRGPANGSWEYLREMAAKGANVSPRDLEHVVALYDRGIAYTDDWIGKLIAGLKERGLYDRTMVVITADHGDEFLDHGHLEHGTTYYEEMMHVPLIVRVPGEGRGRRIEEQVGLVDLMPTMLDVLGVPHDLELQGLSLRPLLDGGSVPERPMFAEASMVPTLETALRTNDTKYIRYARGRGQELYDLKADPKEQTNLCPANPERCRPWAERVEAWRAEMQAAARRLAPAKPSPAAIDPNTRERLRALGYEE
jgi:arylsulfatase A-like enzyme